MSHINARIQHKRDTSSNWTSENPVLLRGELIIVDTADGDTRFKIGDGTKTYTQLPFTDEVILGDITDLNNKLTKQSNDYKNSIISLRVDGTAVTYTKGDGSEYTVYTQDTISAGQTGFVDIGSDSTHAVIIPFEVPSTCTVLVYHNGLLLTEGKHYIRDGSDVNFLDYTASAGDVINFVSMMSLTSVSNSLDEILDATETYIN